MIFSLAKTKWNLPSLPSRHALFRRVSVDMTEGEPLRLITVFALPILAGSIFQQFYNVVDTIVVGRCLGMEALAAVGGVGPICFLVLGLVWGLTMGCAVVTSQRFGAKDDAGVRKSVACAAIVSAASAVLCTAVTIPAIDAALRLMRFPPDVLNGARTYLLWMFGGIFAVALYNFASAEIRALGDSVTPLLFLVLTSFLNIGLDMLFVAAFGWGIHGVAAATIISLLVSGVACLVYGRRRYQALRLRREDWRVGAAFLWEHLRTAVPMATQFSVTALGIAVLQTALNTLGASAIGAFTAASRVEMVVTIPLAAFGVAMATYAAQNFGAGKLDRVRLGVRACGMLLLVCSLVAMAVALSVSGPVTRIFVKEPTADVRAMVRTYLVCTSIFYPALALLFILRNTLQGVGRPAVPFFGGVMELIARSGLAFLFLGLWGYAGVCLAGPAAWLAADIPLVWDYLRFLRSTRHQ